MSPKITEVAQKVRAWAETLPGKYGYRADLCGLCGIASRKLIQEYQRRGILARIVSYPGHTFVILPKHNLLVDVTATQFGYKPVEIRELREGNPTVWNLKRDNVSYYVTAGEFLRFQRSNPNWCSCEVRLSRCKVRG